MRFCLIAFKARRKGFLPHPLVSLIALLVLTFSCGVMAFSAPTIVIVGDYKSAEYLKTFDREMRSRVAHHAIQSIDVAEFEKAVIAENSILIAVGTPALRKISTRANNSNTVIAAFISSYAYGDIVSSNAALSKRSTAVLTDPLMEDQIALATSIRAGTSHLKMGVFVSESDVALKTTLDNISVERDIQFIKREVKEQITPSDFIYLKNQGLNFLLLVPDPQLFSNPMPVSLGEMMLEAYGLNCAFIGFSRSMVKAGSLASVIYTEGQVAQRVVKVIDDFSQFGKLNQPSRPDNISVAINRVVSKSLGLYKNDIQELVSDIKKNGVFSDSSFDIVVIENSSETYL